MVLAAPNDPAVMEKPSNCASVASNGMWILSATDQTSKGWLCRFLAIGRQIRILSVASFQ